MESKRDLELVHQLLDHERDRVRFLLKAYLRTRLHKIEQFAGTAEISNIFTSRSSSQSKDGTHSRHLSAEHAACRAWVNHAPLSGNCVLHRQACFIQEYPWRCSVRQ